MLETIERKTGQKQKQTDFLENKKENKKEKRQCGSKKSLSACTLMITKHLNLMLWLGFESLEIR